MKIIKHGTLYKFECKNCGCVFEACEKEIEIDGYPTCGGNAKAKIQCPDCDSVCYTDAHVIVLDGGFSIKIGPGKVNIP